MVCIDALRADALFNRSEFYSKFNIEHKLDTPNLDWLLKNSTLLKKCVTTSPYTTASHASYFTGCWPKHHSVKDFFKNKLTKPTIYSLLSKKGYETYFCNDFPFILGKYLGFTDGVDHYYMENEIKCLEDFYKSSSNKFAFFHFADIHWPYGYHKFDKKSEIESLSGFLNEQSKITGIPLSKRVKQGPIEAIRKNEHLLLEQNYRMIIDQYCTKKDYNTIMQWYADGVSKFDKGRFDEFITALKANGAFDDPKTMIVFFADHGENWSDEAYGHFNSCDYDVIHVPVLIYSKSIARKIFPTLTRTIDVVPTLAQFLNVGIGEDFDGINIYKTKPSYSVTQSWVSDFKELIGFFEKTKQTNQFIDGKIKSFLLKEAVIKGNKKLEFKYTNSGSIEYCKSSLIKNGQEYLAKFDYGPQLKKYLKAYNKDIDKHQETKVRIKNKILSEFKNLGYYGGTDD